MRGDVRQSDTVMRKFIYGCRVAKIIEIGQDL